MKTYIATYTSNKVNEDASFKAENLRDAKSLAQLYKRHANLGKVQTYVRLSKLANNFNL